MGGGGEKDHQLIINFKIPLANGVKSLYNHISLLICDYTKNGPITSSQQQQGISVFSYCKLSSASDWTARMVPPDLEAFLSHLNSSKWDLSLAGDSFDDAGNIIEHIYCFVAKANDFSIVEGKNQFVSKWSRYDSKDTEGHWEVQHIVSFLFVTAFITKQ